MIGRLRDRAEAGDEDLAERNRIQVPVLPGVGGGGAGVRVVGAVQKIERGEVDKAADADRRVGTRDQERPRKAAAAYRGARRRLGAEGRTGAAARYATRCRRLTLRQLVDAALQQLLIGAQIRQFVGAGGWKTGQQCDRRGYTANRR